MRAAILYGKEQIIVEERQAPGDPAPDEVQVRIRAVGLCGSDLKYFYSGGVSSAIAQPFALGHEAAGEIVAVGRDVDGFRVGDRVVVEPGKPCWTCEQCLNGDYNLCPRWSSGLALARWRAAGLINWPANLCSLAHYP